jgi:hypothetical protein
MRPSLKVLTTAETGPIRQSQLDIQMIDYASKSAVLTVRSQTFWIRPVQQ